MTSYECAICLENIKQNNMYITDCCHKFCNKCFVNWTKTCKDQKSDVKCPTCRTVLEKVIKPKLKEETLVLVIQNTINFDINYMYDEQDEDYDSEDENAQSDYEVDEEIENMPFYNVRVIHQEIDDDDDECYHINRTRELEEELYGESFTY